MAGDLELRLVLVAEVHVLRDARAGEHVEERLLVPERPPAHFDEGGLHDRRQQLALRHFGSLLTAPGIWGYRECSADGGPCPQVAFKCLKLRICCFTRI